MMEEESSFHLLNTRIKKQEKDTSYRKVRALSDLFAYLYRVNFSVLKGLLTTLLGERILIQRLLESKRLNVPIDVISQVTGVSKEVIEKL